MNGLDVIPIQVDHSETPRGLYFWLDTTLPVGLYERLRLSIQVCKICLVEVDFELLVRNVDGFGLRVTESNKSVIVFRIFLLVVRGLEEYGASSKVRNRRGSGLFLVVVLSIIVLKLIETTKVILVVVVREFAPVLVNTSCPITTEISNALMFFNSLRNRANKIDLLIFVSWISCRPGR